MNLKNVGIIHTNARRLRRGVIGAAALWCASAGWAAAPSADARWSWQEPQATVLPTGDLAWAPRPFEFVQGASVRYIDYAAGSDANAGDTKTAAWKHHPWDPVATGVARACAGIHTYVFKRGVAYRGTLTAKESGREGAPIILTSDPDWGVGEAALYGSVKLAGGWRRGDAQTAPGIPEPEKVWFIDLGEAFHPWCVWETRQGASTRIDLARTPNAKISNPDDPMGDWYEWTDPRRRGMENADAKHLTQSDPHYYDGAFVWSEWQDSTGNMGLPYRSPVLAYDPARHAIKRNQTGPFGAALRGQRYYLENLPAFLDAPGEYFFAEKGTHAGRLYLRLPDDRDPNESEIELGREQSLLTIKDQSHIAVRGLRFSYLNAPPHTALVSPNEFPSVYFRPTAIRLVGNCRDVQIDHNRFIDVVAAVLGAPRLSVDLLRKYAPDLENHGATDRLDDVTVADNDIAHVDEAAIILQDGAGDGGFRGAREHPSGELGRVSILRNRVVDAVFRPSSSYNGPAIGVTNATVAEIAGNIVDRCWGVGLWALGGKLRADERDRPLIRVLVHHNKVTNALLAANDWGAIAVWQGGVFYVFDNVVGNPVGPKHEVLVNNKPTDPGFPAFREYSSNAYAIYLDGAYKSYLFNNITWGKYHDLDHWLKNRAAFMMVLGFMNQWFNNTAYGFTYGATGSSGQRTAFLGNVFTGMTNAYFGLDGVGDISLQGGGVNAEGIRKTSATATLAYGSNVFFGRPASFTSKLSSSPAATLEEFRATLAPDKPRAGDVGVAAERPPLVAPEKFDFRPTADSAARGRGVRVFVPWALSMTVAEWTFCRLEADPRVVLGENLFMSDEYVERAMYYEVPRNDLLVPAATAVSYVAGPLEDWTAGALAFNGVDTFGLLPDRELKADYTASQALVSEGKGKKLVQGAHVYPGAQRRTVDMGTNNFLVEIYFKAAAGHAGGVLVSKAADAGYVLDLDDAGHVRMTLRAGGKELCQRIGATVVNDAAWHHVIAEVDRTGEHPGIRLYLDGRADDGKATGEFPATGVSLATTADFLVGKGAEGRFFAGAVDFLRVSRGTLADAKTTIDELYAWEFAGPALADFTGHATGDVKRDAGAIQFR